MVTRFNPLSSAYLSAVSASAERGQYLRGAGQGNRQAGHFTAIWYVCELKLFISLCAAVQMLCHSQFVAAAGEIAVVGPPLSCLDADLSFQGSTTAGAKDARQAAQMNAAAQEARSLLGRQAQATFTVQTT